MSRHLSIAIVARLKPPHERNRRCGEAAVEYDALPAPLAGPARGGSCDVGLNRVKLGWRAPLPPEAARRMPNDVLAWAAPVLAPASVARCSHARAAPTAQASANTAPGQPLRATPPACALRAPRERARNLRKTARGYLSVHGWTRPHGQGAGVLVPIGADTRPDPQRGKRRLRGHLAACFPAKRAATPAHERSPRGGLLLLLMAQGTDRLTKQPHPNPSAPMGAAGEAPTCTWSGNAQNCLAPAKRDLEACDIDVVPVCASARLRPTCRAHTQRADLAQCNAQHHG